MSYRKMKFYVGLFSILFLLGLISISILIMDKKGLLDEYNRYYFKTKNAQAFYIGMPLRLSGFEIGNISDMKLLNDGEVKIDIKIKRVYSKWITRETKLIINRPFIGSPTVDIFTISKRFPLRDNQEIREVVIKDDIDDIIAKLQPIVKKLQKIVDNVEVATNKLASKDSSVNKSLQNIEKFTAKLASDRPFLTLLTGDENSTKDLVSAISKSTKTVDNLNSTIKEANSTINQLKSKFLPPLSGSAEALLEIMTDVKGKLKKLDGVVDEISSSKRDIKRLKRDIRVNLHKTNRVIDRVDGVFHNQKSKVELP